MGAWRPRVAREVDGTLHLVYARYDDADPRQRCGLAGIAAFISGKTVEELRTRLRDLESACDEPVIAMTEFEYEPGDDDDEEEP